MKNHCTFLLIICLLFTFPLMAQESEPLVGWLSVQWGDPHPDSELPPARKLTLTEESGVINVLKVSDELMHGPVSRWNGQKVKVYPRPGAQARALGEPLAVAAVRLVDGAASLGGVSGSQPWVSILCKFADIGAEPENLSYFQNMYANTPGGLDHYWREVSYNKINVVGSIAIDWVNLPQAQGDYIPTPGSNFDADLDSLFDDCTAAADPFVDFSNGGSPFAGINMMFNDLLDCCAWGGGRFATLDGVSKSWRVTWEPPWGYRDEGVIAHEMGHGFGLPHANNWDADGNPYDSPWDVMSAATSYSASDPTYGRLGKHVNAYHKDSLGWFDAGQRFEALDGTSTTITLDHTALAGSTNYQMASIPIPGTSIRYTVEARLRSGDYESNLPGDCVIIHEVAPGRSEPSWAVDSDVPPANFGDNEGTMWRVGETFQDVANSISVRVDSATATGFVVTITVGDVGEIFSDGFDSGDTSAWSFSS